MAAQMIVRHGAMRLLGSFTVPQDLALGRRDPVIVRTQRGLEAGQVLSEASERAVKLLENPTEGEIVRLQTEEDRQCLQELKATEREEMELCRELSQQRKLQMELVDVEHLFGGERIIFYFLAEKRVDFRELVKDLARRFRTRIEMRQIGIRDEAKLLADYGDCGKPVCCNTHMTKMPPVSMRMAKLQKSTLDPSKISGRCGRLKCCLRFEQHVYEAHQKELPKVGSRARTTQGEGRILAVELLTRQVVIELDDGRRLPMKHDEILEKLGRKKGSPPHQGAKKKRRK